MKNSVKTSEFLGVKASYSLVFETSECYDMLIIVKAPRYRGLLVLASWRLKAYPGHITYKTTEAHPGPTPTL